MREVGYDSAFMFKYSERPGTYASKHLPDDVPEEVKIRRLNELIALQTEISAQQNKMVVFNKGSHHIGQTVRVRITGSTSATLLGEAIVQ